MCQGHPEFASRRVVDQFKVELVFTDFHQSPPMRRAVHMPVVMSGVVVAGALLFAAGGETGEADEDQEQGEMGRFHVRGKENQ